ncbi:MAG: uridine monophosphate kinase [Clostridia bacterium]|nr:uridine monophosphate kinase [Clostridia bacterium]
MIDIKYKRAFLKLSGEALALKGEDGSVKEIFDDKVIDDIAEDICACTDLGVEIGIMIGAGNIWRGRMGKNLDHAKADHMGMLATTINCLRMQDALQKMGCNAVVMTTVTMDGFTEVFSHEKAKEYLKAKRPVIFGCGAGIPFISTDTAGVIKALEIGAEIILMAKNIDGVYTADPNVEKDAKRFRVISYKECLDRELKATDASASAIAQENKIDTLVFSLKEKDAVKRAVCGLAEGTLITAEHVPSEFY